MPKSRHGSTSGSVDLKEDDSSSFKSPDSPRSGINESPEFDPGSSAKQNESSPGVERRRSGRSKREKPDYYDALDFEHHKPLRAAKSTPTRATKRGQGSGDRQGSPGGRSEDGRSRLAAAVKSPKMPRGRPPSGRATLTWKKGVDNDDDDKDHHHRRKKGKKSNTKGRGRAAALASSASRDQDDSDGDDDAKSSDGKSKKAKGEKADAKETANNASTSTEDEEPHMMDEVTAEKNLQCRVGLAEINRKLGVVMWQPTF